MIRYFVLIVVGFCLFPMQFSFANNTATSLPIFQKTKADNIALQKVQTVKTTPFRTIRRYQKKWQRILHLKLQQFKRNFSIYWLIPLFGISFFYGVLHAMGPGHGKAIISAYLLQNRLNMLGALKLSTIVAFTHTGSALFIAILMQSILASMQGIKNQIAIHRYFSLTSALLIIIIGLWLLYKNIKQKKKTTKQDDLKQSGLLSIGLAAGIIPCPVSLTIVMLSISYNIFIVGLVSVLAISLGMALLLFTLCILLIHSKRKILAIFEKKHSEEKTYKLIRIVNYISSVFIIILGIVTFSMFY